VNKRKYHFQILIFNFYLKMELYTIWKDRSEQHDREAHQLKQWRYIEDPSCDICHPWRNNDNVGSELEEHFTIFWNSYQEMYNAHTYTWKTMQNFGSLLVIEPSVRRNIQNNIIHEERPNRQLQQMHENVKALMESIRYSEAPSVNTTQMVTSVVRMITLINQMREEEDQEQIEIMTTEKEQIVEEKFTLFWEWYQTITTAQSYSPEVKESFGKLLDLEAEITDMSNREARMHLNRVVKRTAYQNNDYITTDLIMQIIDRFIYSKNFKYNHEETEENRRQILKSSKENTPEESPDEISPEKTPEILSPIPSETKEHQSNEDIDEELDINTPHFPPEVENSDTEELTINNPEETNFNPILPPQPENNNLNMDQNQFKEVMVQLYGADPADNTNQTPRNIGAVMDAQTNAINNLINAHNNRNGGKIVEPPAFYGRDDEDPHRWLELFEQAFDTNGWRDGNEQQRKIQIVAGYLRDAAFDWYRQASANIQRYEDGTHNGGNNDFKKLFLEQYSTPTKRNMWTQQLTRMTQGSNETVDDYARRFRSVLTRATHGHNLAAVYQVGHFINGLKLNLKALTLMDNPADLNAAINRAKLIESSYGSVNDMVPNITNNLPPIQSTPIQQNTQPPVQQNQQTDNMENKIDELTKQMENLKINMIRDRSNNGRRPNEFNRPQRPQMNQMNRPRLQCEYCRGYGHTEDRCYVKELVCFKCNKRGHSSRYCNERRSQSYNVNYFDEDYYDNDYYDDEYYDDYYDDEDVYYTQQYEIYEADRKNKHMKRGRPNKNKNPDHVSPIRMQQTPRDELPPQNMQTDKKPRRARGHNRYDDEKDYNIVEDFVNQRANITFGELLKNSPNQAKNLRGSLARKLVSVENNEH
jgi:hypothetical protein